MAPFIKKHVQYPSESSSLVSLDESSEYEDVTMTTDNDIEILDDRMRSKTKRCKYSSKQFSHMYYYYVKSGKCINDGSLSKALKYINLALEACNKNDKFLSKIYERRGNIYAALNKPRCSFRGFLDWEKAYKIDPDNMKVRKSMCKTLFKAANKYYRMKAYLKALAPLQLAYRLYSDNIKVCALLSLVKKYTSMMFRTQQMRKKNYFRKHL